MAVRKFKVAGSAASANTESDTGTPMYDASRGLPDAGPYRAKVRYMRVGETGQNSQEPGTPKVIFMFETSEPDGTKKAKFNGYPSWEHIPATDQQSGRLNAVLDALFSGKTKSQVAKVKKDFWASNISYDDQTQNVTKIGTMAVPEDAEVGINLRKDRGGNGYDPSMRIASIYGASKLPEPVAADDEDEYEEPDTEESEEEDTEEEGDEMDERTEELEAMKIAELRAVAKELGLKTLKKDAATLVEEILAEEDEPDEEDEEEPDDEEDEEEEEEPEPPKRTKRTPARRAKKGDDSEPPF